MTVAVREIRVNPNWDISSKNFDADIALLTLDDEVAFNRFIQPICLIEPRSEIEFLKDSVAVGYGYDENGNLDMLPKMVRAPILENVDCFLANPFLATISSPRTLCAAYVNQSGPSRGDSGGGIFVSQNERYFFRGVLSAAESRRRNENDFFIFTPLSFYNDWIDGIISEVHKGNNQYGIYPR